jgi:hypothetical protein
MRSVLRPVAISCNQSTYHDPFAALIDARAPSETASGASSMLKWPISCKKTNVAKLAFSEVRPGQKPESIAPPHNMATVLVNFTRSASYSRHEHYDRTVQENGKKARRLLVPRQDGKESRRDSTTAVLVIRRVRVTL